MNHRTALFSREWVVTLAITSVLAGCASEETAPNLISDETFVEYYAAVVRAHQSAGDNPQDLEVHLEAQPLPPGWRDQLITFVEIEQKTASEWLTLLSRARSLAGE